MTEPGDVTAFFRQYTHDTIAAVDRLPLGQVRRVVELLSEARSLGRQIFICGNGGSAATASHFANDLGKGASLGRSERFRVMSLTDNIPWITSLANDLDYSQIFVEQLKNFADVGDLVLAFSGSGNSPNVIEAIRWARGHGLVTMGFTGRAGGRLAKEAEIVVQVDSDHMGVIEDGHFVIQHLIGYYFMNGESGRGGGRERADDEKEEAGLSTKPDKECRR